MDEDDGSSFSLDEMPSDNDDSANVTCEFVLEAIERNDETASNSAHGNANGQSEFSDKPLVEQADGVAKDAAGADDIATCADSVVAPTEASSTALVPVIATATAGEASNSNAAAANSADAINEASLVVAVDNGMASKIVRLMVLTANVDAVLSTLLAVHTHDDQRDFEHNITERFRRMVNPLVASRAVTQNMQKVICENLGACIGTYLLEFTYGGSPHLYFQSFECTDAVKPLRHFDEFATVAEAHAAYFAWTVARHTQNSLYDDWAIGSNKMKSARELTMSAIRADGYFSEETYDIMERHVLRG